MSDSSPVAAAAADVDPEPSLGDPAQTPSLEDKDAGSDVSSRRKNFWARFKRKEKKKGRTQAAATAMVEVDCDQASRLRYDWSQMLC